MAIGGISRSPVFARSINPNLSRTLAISKPTHMQTGQARACRQSSSGSMQHRIARSKEILSKTRIFTPEHCPLLETIDIFARCLATFGNGRGAPTRLTPAIAQHPARSVNTTANSCATNTFCVAVPAPPPAHTSAAPIAISFNRKTLAIPRNPTRARRTVNRYGASHRARQFNLTMTGDSVTAPPQVSAPESADFLADVIAGLLSNPRTIPCKYFYDERGAALFQKICELPEYYVTRAEIDILDRCRADIASQLGPSVELIGLGAGAGTNTGILMEAPENPAVYIPVDISKKQLRQSAALFRKTFRDLEILPVCADYLQPVVLPSPSRKAARNIVYFPGSTIGNFEPDEALQFLRRIANVCRGGGGLLIGVDLKKDRQVLEAAYNDSAGV